MHSAGKAQHRLRTIPKSARQHPLSVRRFQADGLLLVCVAIWGLNFVVTKYALEHYFSPLAFAVPRYALAAGIFGAAVAVQARTNESHVTRRDRRLIVAVGVSLVAVNQLSFIYALDWTNASTVALLFGTMPMFTAILSKNRDNRHWLAAMLSVVGVALVAIGGAVGPSGNAAGILVGLIPPATFALYSIMLRPFVQRYSSIRVNALATGSAVLPLVGVTLATLGRQHWDTTSTSAWLLLAYSAVIAYALTNIIWFRLVAVAGAERVALYVNLQPFLGALFGVMILSEQLGRLQVTGGVAIAAGLVLARWRRPLTAPAE